MIPLENINNQTCFFPIWGPTEYKEMLSTKRSRQYIDIKIMINMLFECLSGGRSVFPLCCHGLYPQKELRVHIYLQ